MRNSQTLIDAIHHLDHAIVDKLLSAGLDPDVPITHHKVTMTPLMEAARLNNLSAAKMLLAHKANIDWQNNIGQTALMVALAKRSLDVFNLLLESKANTEIRNNNGQTALICAVDHFDIYKYERFIYALVDAGADTRKAIEICRNKYSAHGRDNFLEAINYINSRSECRRLDRSIRTNLESEEAFSF